MSILEIAANYYQYFLRGTRTTILVALVTVFCGALLGCAIALPVARALHQAGNQVDLIGGFKTKDIVILEEEMGKACTDLHICTDDGTYGYHGFVTGKLEELTDQLYEGLTGISFDGMYSSFIDNLMNMK